MRQDTQAAAARRETRQERRGTEPLQTFTVVGYLPAGSGYFQAYSAKDWPMAIQQAMRAYPDLQPICVLKGRVAPIGRWENLPAEAPSWSPKLLLAQEKIFSMFGFNLAGDAEELHAFKAPDWILAAHQIMRLKGTTYQFVGAVEGLVPVVGTWTMLKESVLAGSLEPPTAAEADNPAVTAS